MKIAREELRGKSGCLKLLFLLLLSWLSLSGSSLAQTANVPILEKSSDPQKEYLLTEEKPREYRFLWVTRFQLQTTKDISLVVERAKKYNYNALFVQVFALGEAFYHSQLAPWGKGVSPDLDPLKELIGQAKKNEIEVHAWMNMAFVWGNKDLPSDPKHVLRQHPEWALRDKKGRSILDYSVWEKKWAKLSGIYLDLSIPEAREYLAQLCLEVARNYEVDGLHFDYVRYPNNVLGYSREAIEEFQKEFQIDPSSLVLNKGIALKVFGKERYQELLTAWDAFRCRQPGLLIAKVREEVQRYRRQIILSAAVVADLEQAKKNYFQDWGEWLKEGLLDVVVPMSYAKNNEEVQQQIGQVVQLAHDFNRGAVIGLGAWRQNPGEVAEKVLFTRKVREEMGFRCLLGISLFSYDSLSKDGEYLPELRRTLFPTPALLPRLFWREEQAQAALNEQIPTASSTW